MSGRFDSDVFRAIAAVVIAMVIGVALGRPTADHDANVVATPVVDVLPNEPGFVTVHVSGAVASPGLVEVPETSRVADVIAAAGGVTVDADLAGINLADGVIDGSQVVVPATGAASGIAPGVAHDSKVRLNSAEASDLESLPGVGPVLAEKIIEHRDEFGPFSAVEDLLEVSGIGERKLASIRDLVVVP